MDRDVGSVMDGPAGQAIGDDVMNHSDDDPSQDDDRRALQAKSDSRSISRSRSRSPQQALPEKKRNHTQRQPTTQNKGGPVTTLKIGTEDAAFLLGAGGSTKRKVATAAGARLDLNDAADGDGHELEIHGSDEARARAKDYVAWVLAQRLGAITVDVSTPRTDLSVVDVPPDCVAYVMGKHGKVLRSMETEFGTLMFFGSLVGNVGGDGNADNGSDGSSEMSDKKSTEVLCILGNRRGRRGSELKVMSAVEHKTPGCFVGTDGKLKKRLSQSGDNSGDGWGYDTFPFKDREFSYALGAQGSTRKKLASASGALLEYVGAAAVIAGDRGERSRCWDYLSWLLKQRRGGFHVSPDGRDDVTELRIPKGAAGRLQGNRGETLRAIEKDTNTFCFVTEDRDDPTTKEALMLIFGSEKLGRYKALDLMEDAMSGRYRAPDTSAGEGGDRGREGGDRNEGGRRGGDNDRGHRDDDRTRGGGRDDTRRRGGGGGGPDRGGDARGDRDDRRDRNGPYGSGRKRGRSRDHGREREGRDRDRSSRRSDRSPERRDRSPRRSDRSRSPRRNDRDNRDHRNRRDRNKNDGRAGDLGTEQKSDAKPPTDDRYR